MPIGKVYSAVLLASMLLPNNYIRRYWLQSAISPKGKQIGLNQR